MNLFESEKISLMGNIKIIKVKYIPPARYVFVLMGFLGFNIIYALRVNLSVALVSMVTTRSNSNAEDSGILKTPCAHHILNASFQSNLSPKRGEFDWDEATQGIILGSFFWGYITTQLPGGRMAETTGSKWLLGYGIFFTSLFTILSPIAARIHYTLFIACRVLEGICEGVTFPAMHSMIAKWLPKFERSFMSAVIYSGAQIGTVITLPLTALLCDLDMMGGWPFAFYLFGFLGIIWSIFWAILVYESPEAHPNISQQELRYILQGQSNEQIQKDRKMPWKFIFKSIPVWALVVAHFGQNWGFYTLLTQMPNYLKNVLDFDLRSNGIISALPYLLQAVVGWFVGYFCDRIYRTRKYRISTIRKLCNTIGFLGPALCLYGITIAECNYLWNVVFLILAMGFNGFVFAGFSVTHVDMSPNFAGTLMGITNCIATFSGVLAPYVVGLTLQNKNSSVLHNWNSVFYISCSVYITTSIIFVIFGSAELQFWNSSDVDSLLVKDKRLKVSESINCDKELSKIIVETTKLK